MRQLVMTTAVVAMIVTAAAPVHAQAVAGADKAVAVAGDAGISSMVVLERPEFRILRDYAEPGATRRMHSHDDATYHVFVLVTGQLRLTLEGAAPVDVTPGEALYLKGGARHTFVNTGGVAATIVEVFGKAPKAGAEALPAGDLAALAQAFAASAARRPQGR